jgi:hypothetical protein
MSLPSVYRGRIAAQGGCLDEACGRNLGERVLDDSLQLDPVETAIETEAQPAPMADVGRHEEPVGLGSDEHFLHPGRRRAPNREAIVAVVIRQDHQKGARAPDEEGRRAVTRPLDDLWETETRPP